MRLLGLLLLVGGLAAAQDNLDQYTKTPVLHDWRVGEIVRRVDSGGKDSLDKLIAKRLGGRYVDLEIESGGQVVVEDDSLLLPEHDRLSRVGALVCYRIRIAGDPHASLGYYFQIDYFTEDEAVESPCGAKPKGVVKVKHIGGVSRLEEQSAQEAKQQQRVLRWRRLRTQ